MTTVSDYTKEKKMRPFVQEEGKQIKSVFHHHLGSYHVDLMTLISEVQADKKSFTTIAEDYSTLLELKVLGGRKTT